MKAFFKLAIEIGEKECELDLREQVPQVHKDYAKGIEAARKECFPGSRPCDDYAHMRRATHKVLESMMCRGIVSAPQHLTDWHDTRLDLLSSNSNSSTQCRIMSCRLRVETNVDVGGRSAGE